MKPRNMTNFGQFFLVISDRLVLYLVSIDKGRHTRTNFIIEWCSDHCI